MTDAPETIFANKESGSADWDAGTFCTVDDGGTSFTLTDHSQALIASAYEAAAVALRLHCWPEDGTYDPANLHETEMQSAERGTVEYGSLMIRELIPADAQATLDKLIADAERRGMECAACEMEDKKP
jgi:peroxiredoxin family protein